MIANGNEGTHHIEASCKHNDVKFTFLSSIHDAFLSELFNRCAILLVDVDNLNIVLVEDLVIVLLKARSFDTKCMWRSARKLA